MMVAAQPEAKADLGYEALEFNRKVQAITAHYGRGSDDIDLWLFSKQLDGLYAAHKPKLDGLMLIVTWAQRFRRPISLPTLSTVSTLLIFEAFRFAALRARKYGASLDRDDVVEAADMTWIDVNRRLQLKPSQRPEKSQGGGVETRLSVFSWANYSDFCRTVNTITANKLKDVLEKRHGWPQQAESGVLDAWACHDMPAWVAELLRQHEAGDRGENPQPC